MTNRTIVFMSAQNSFGRLAATSNSGEGETDLIRNMIIVNNRTILPTNNPKISIWENQTAIVDVQAFDDIGGELSSFNFGDADVGQFMVDRQLHRFDHLYI